MESRIINWHLHANHEKKWTINSLAVNYFEAKIKKTVAEKEDQIKSEMELPGT